VSSSIRSPPFDAGEGATLQEEKQRQAGNGGERR
jgi:hypothetical protein